MVAALSQGGAAGTETYSGERKALLTDNSTTPLKVTRGKLAKVVITVVGTAWVIDIYDDPATTNNRVYSWVTADGKVKDDLQFPMSNGITVVSSGTAPGLATIVYS